MIEIKTVDYDLSLKWFIIRYCNFNCPGCIEGADGNIHNFTSQQLLAQTDQAKVTGQKILNLIRSYSNKSIKLSITGGESSLVDLEYVFQDWDYYGENNKLHLIMITNFSAPNEKYKSFFALLDKYGITHSLTTSIHESQWVNQNYLINKIIDMKDYIKCVNYVINDDNVDIVLDYFHKLEPYVKQRIGVERNKNVEYLVSDKVWDAIQKCEVKKQMSWVENGILTKYDMDTMLKEKIPAEGFYGWKCYPVIQIMPDGRSYICHNKPIDLNKNSIPEYVYCQRKKKCTPYNFIKAIKE